LNSLDVGAHLEQRRKALRRANVVRGTRAKLKRRIAAGELSAAEVILSSGWEVESMPIETLLTSQRGWGRERCSRFLRPIQIREKKTIGSMTERQRTAVAALLSRVA